MCTYYIHRGLPWLALYRESLTNDEMELVGFRDK
jgi:hypothetical protein